MAQQSDGFDIDSGSNTYTAEQQQDFSDTLSGTIRVGKCQSSMKYVMNVVKVEEPIWENFSGLLLGTSTRSVRPYTVFQYAALSKKNDNRYQRILEFRLKVSINNSVSTYFSDSEYLTSDMLLAIREMRKTGGFATFHSIKKQRAVGIVTLPSFTYNANDPAISGIDLVARARESN